MGEHRPIPTKRYRYSEDPDILCDFYAHSPGKRPVLVCFHGGAYTCGDSKDVEAAVISVFQDCGFVILCPDYRLLPETNFAGQQNDISRLELWIRNDFLSFVGEEFGISICGIVVLGTSSGGHLALLTPKLWAQNPDCIITISAPTSMDLPNRRHHITLQDMDSKFLHDATDFEHPPTTSKPAQNDDDRKTPRNILGRYMFLDERIGQYLTDDNPLEHRGLELVLPQKRRVPESKIRSICPDMVCEDFRFPPVVLVHALDDLVISSEHSIRMEDKLQSLGIESQLILLDNGGHAPRLPLDVITRIANSAQDMVTQKQQPTSRGGRDVRPKRRREGERMLGR